MTSNSLESVLVTGANTGIGFEATRQLVDCEGVKKIVLGCRTAEKCKQAIEKLLTLTKKPKELFDFVVIDTSNRESCLDAAKAVSVPLDGLILNAGGALENIAGNLTEDGVEVQFATNVFGHAIFTEELINLGKLNENANVVFSSSETARGVVATVKRPNLVADVEHMKGYVNKSRYGNKFNSIASYATAKAIGTLYFSALARAHPEFRILSVSPGFTFGTGATENLPLCEKITYNLLAAIPCSACLGIGHQVESGAARYVDGLCNQELKSGRFYASSKYAAAGRLIDQGTIDNNFDDNVSLQDTAFNTIHHFMDKEE